MERNPLSSPSLSGILIIRAGSLRGEQPGQGCSAAGLLFASCPVLRGYRPPTACSSRVPSLRPPHTEQPRFPGPVHARVSMDGGTHLSRCAAFRKNPFPWPRFTAFTLLLSSLFLFLSQGNRWVRVGGEFMRSIQRVVSKSVSLSRENGCVFVACRSVDVIEKICVEIFLRSTLFHLRCLDSEDESFPFWA